ncbi:MAG: ATP-dependent zinc metalloprotease FTSH 4, mitochondrial [Heterodermia speciosa]|uniref:ATP-dependent zinc metalloprotease FTSH 4, mitochondrial n=1 Tax=Heterodermia speciosa TaxID=116794 RepID=A0A8H3F2J4_9LECA|nr:MAG: ATP-dependent zinc metalloprotease FTSH 4, mitochondrial [Heterodermia speciosa]
MSQRRGLFGSGAVQNLLSHIEQNANNNPTSATAQNAFYSALLRADMPAIVVERFQTGRYASNAACQANYNRALEKVGGAAALGSGIQPSGQGLNNQQLQAIGQALAAQSKGENLSISAGKNSASGSGAKESPLYVVVEESIGGAIFKWAKFLLYFGLVTYFTLVVMTIAVETSGVLRKVTGATQNEAQPQDQTVRFSDVHGCDEAKEDLQELVEFLKNPERFSSLGGRLPKGFLLEGPPGTGKTLLARAVAGEAGVPFFFMSGAEFDEIYVGVGAKRVRELFQNARAKAPAIIFIDELDAIGGKRNERDPAYVKQSLNQLLTEMDGFTQETGVVIIAATNFPKLLDKALTRPGRFDRNIVVPLPDVRGRMEILKHHMKNVQISTDVDESVIARGTVGFSGAELENLVNQAAVRASRNKAKKVAMADFDWAKDKIMMGAERRSAVIQEKDKIMTAYHEGGHALMALFTKGATPLYKVTIMPRGRALGVTHSIEEMDKVSESKAEMLAHIDVCMGGKVAEEIVYGPDNVTSGCSSDLQAATNVAWAMVTLYGMSEVLGQANLANNYEQLSSETKQKIESEIRRILDDSRQRVTKLLNERRTELDTLARSLVDYETLSVDEVQKVLKGEKLPKMTSTASMPLKLPEIVLPPGFGGVPSPGSGGIEGSTGQNNSSGPESSGGATI